MWGIFKKQDSNEKLLKNIEIYEQKKREKQSQTGTIKRNKSYRQKDKKS
jgi:hypothetical protein|tara:strand:+ start:127 stop:273 length:147 start_codon:yes stop_codon:yes gene_type:complete